MISRQLALTCALLGAASSTQATSVVPLTLPQLASEADSIVRVRVLDRGARRGVFHDAPAIVTDLEFEVLDVLKGHAPRGLTVFGGTVGEQTLSLVGQPVLRAGDEAFVFLITKDEVTCPYVGVWQGVYPVRDGQVWREGAPVVDVIDGAVAFALDHERGMAPVAFASEVRRALQEPAAETRLAPVRAGGPVRAPQAAEKPAVATVKDGTPTPLRLTPTPHSHPRLGAAHAAGGAQ